MAVRIQMLRSATGPDGVYRKGGTYEVTEELANSFERVGICRVIAAEKKAPTRQAAQETEAPTKRRTYKKRK